MPPADPDPVTVVLPVHNPGGAFDPAVGDWLAALGKLGREHELVVVDDGSTDGTADRAADLAARRPHVRVLRHDARRGYGACLRAALAEARHPLVATAALDYPYTPADLGLMLDRVGRPEEVAGRVVEVSVVVGRRMGRPVPAGWRAVGWVYRLFMRAALGNPRDPLPAWLGLRAEWQGWVAWAVFGNPLADVNSAFKLYRRAVFDKFPIQSDGDFVHAEVIAKATFTTCMLDEVPLTPKPDPVPAADWADFGKVLRDAKFTPPAAAAPAEPEPAAVPAQP